MINTELIPIREQLERIENKIDFSSLVNNKKFSGNWINGHEFDGHTPTGSSANTSLSRVSIL